MTGPIHREDDVLARLIRHGIEALRNGDGDGTTARAALENVERLREERDSARAEVERLQRIVDSVRGKTALDVVAEKLQAQDEVERLREERDSARAEVERLREEVHRHRSLARVAKDDQRGREAYLADGVERLRDALRQLLDVTDHRTLNEQMVGGDHCACIACSAARQALEDTA